MLNDYSCLTPCVVAKVHPVVPIHDPVKSFDSLNKELMTSNDGLSNNNGGGFNNGEAAGGKSGSSGGIRGVNNVDFDHIELSSNGAPKVKNEAQNEKQIEKSDLTINKHPSVEEIQKEKSKEETMAGINKDINNKNVDFNKKKSNGVNLININDNVNEINNNNKDKLTRKNDEKETFGNEVGDGNDCNKNNYPRHSCLKHLEKNHSSSHAMKSYEGGGMLGGNWDDGVAGANDFAGENKNGNYSCDQSVETTKADETNKLYPQGKTKLEEFLII